MTPENVSAASKQVQNKASNLKTLLHPFGIEAPEICIDDLVLDSREVAIHKIFLALPGHDLDGRDFIPQAISLGAKVILAEADDPSLHGNMEMREHTLIIQFHDLSGQIANLAAHFFENAADNLETIAVTGTNGKTSTTHFCCQLSNLLNKPSMFVGTLGAGPIEALKKTKNTTPDVISMHRFAYQAKHAACKSMAFEASSHALAQGRLNAFHTKVAIFTNLTRDHLDYHGSMSEYAAAKRKLLKQPGLSHVIVNADDPEHRQWLSNMNSNCEAVLFGVGEVPESIEHYIFAGDVVCLNTGIKFELRSSWGHANVTLPLIGHFNISNVLASAAAQLVLGESFEDVVNALQKIKPVDGRGELIKIQNGPAVVVDYAHTPDALDKILTAIRQHCSGQILCVFGCGGDRDQGKRPLMGGIAESLADQVVITDDNARNEDPAQIAEDIKAGMRMPEKCVYEPEREKAIEFAVAAASNDDVVLVAGKGHEDYQISGERIREYNERQFIYQRYEVLQ